MRFSISSALRLVVGMVPLLTCTCFLDLSESGSSSARVVRAAPLNVSAGALRLDASPAGPVAQSVDVNAIGASGVASEYDFTSPGGTAMSFAVSTSLVGNQGAVEISVARVNPDGASVSPNPLWDLWNDGLRVSGAGTFVRGSEIVARGDGFTRLTITGAIQDTELLRIRSYDPSGGITDTSLVRIRPGEESEINLSIPSPLSEYDGLKDLLTIYSSQSAVFGMPTVAVSGDRVSIVCYEGDQSPEYYWPLDKYELRMQYDMTSGAATGGGSEETNQDSGNWRDHEIAGLYNVLALVHCDGWSVSVRLSFDRGASFGQNVSLDNLTGGGRRLIQVAMAADYTLGIAYWSEADRSAQLKYVEGHPSQVDAFGSLLRYQFGTSHTLYSASAPDGYIPAVIGMDFTSGGDLVIVYNESTRASFGGDGGPIMVADSAAAAEGGFQAAEPPPLAPGMTEALPPPDPDDANQLRILRLP